MLLTLLHHWQINGTFLQLVVVKRWNTSLSISEQLVIQKIILCSYKHKKREIRNQSGQKPSETIEMWLIWLADEGTTLSLLDKKEWNSLNWLVISSMPQTTLATTTLFSDMSPEEELVKINQDLLEWVFTYIWNSCLARMSFHFVIISHGRKPLGEAITSLRTTVNSSLD